MVKESKHHLLQWVPLLLSYYLTSLIDLISTWQVQHAWYVALYKHFLNECPRLENYCASKQIHFHLETASLSISKTDFSNQLCTLNTVRTRRQHLSSGSAESNVKVTEWNPVIKKAKNNKTPSSSTIKLFKWLMVNVRSQQREIIQKQQKKKKHYAIFVVFVKLCSYFRMKAHRRLYSMWSGSIRHRINGAVSQKRCGEMKWKEGQRVAGIDPTCHTQSSWLLQREGFGHITFCACTLTTERSCKWPTTSWFIFYLQDLLILICSCLLSGVIINRDWGSLVLCIIKCAWVMEDGLHEGPRSPD